LPYGIIQAKSDPLFTQQYHEFARHTHLSSFSLNSYNSSGENVGIQNFILRKALFLLASDAIHK
jgi:hypothetical protein